jgi:pimeloyl-ACP methyl ester carboxylesterase
MEPESRFFDIGIRLHVRLWKGSGENGADFVLLHGLASNSRLWDQVAAVLCRAGHTVACVDQRGHGLSDKPDGPYDFATVADDLRRLLDAMGWERPLAVGQSWGGNAVLEFGVRHPGRARGLGLVDGGFIDLQGTEGATWEQVSRELRPPNLIGTPWAAIRERIRAANPEWSDAALDTIAGNFEILPDESVRPWLTLDRHMAILRALWEQRPAELFPRVREPVVLCAAAEGRYGKEHRRQQVAALEAGLPRVAVHWFPDTAHDIHLHRPLLLARVLLEELEKGIWATG